MKKLLIAVCTVLVYAYLTSAFGMPSPDSVTVAWDAPNLEVEIDGINQHIPLDGYRVYVGEQDGVHSFLGCETEDTSCIITDLQMCTEYWFMATAFNEHGESNDSDSIRYMIGEQEELCGTSSAAVEPDQEFVDEEDTNGISDNPVSTDGSDHSVDGSADEEQTVVPQMGYNPRSGGDGGCFIESILKGE